MTPSTPVHTQELSRLVRATVKEWKARTGASWRDISKRLEAIDVHQSESNLASKLSNGTMSAQLFLAIAQVLGQSTIDVEMPGDSKQHDQ